MHKKILLLLLILAFGAIALFVYQNKLYFSVESQFKNYQKEYNAEVLLEDNLNVWWISSDNLNIINENSPGVQLNINNCREDISTRSIFYKTAQELGLKMDKILQDNGFTINASNSSKSIQDEEFYDYVRAYEKNDKKCTFTASPDCASLMGEKQMHYTFSFACTDKFKENYSQQAPYLKDLGIKNAVVSVQQKKGDFILLGVNYRRSGSYIIAKYENGKWKELFAGQDLPPCSIVEENKIPKEIAPKCY